MSKRPRKAYRHEDGTWRLPLTRGLETTIDEEDVAFAEQWCWCAYKACMNKTYYASRHASVGDTRVMRLHREIAARAGLSTEGQVDHIDLNGLNNRRSNLRTATSSDNKCNMAIRADNTSGVKGVSFDSRTGMWSAKIQKDGNVRWLGRFESLEKAAAAVAVARLEMHGEFART